MGYPMTFHRFCDRNQLDEHAKHDLRRLVVDQTDELHLIAYGRAAGITPEQAKIVMDNFFSAERVTSLLTSEEYIELYEKNDWGHKDYS